MSRVYVEIDGVKVEVVKFGKSLWKPYSRYVDLVITSPDAPSNTHRLCVGESVTVKVSHEYLTGEL